MKTAVAFGETDLGLVKANMTLVVKTMTGVAVDNTGWTMTESQRGSYEIDVPLAIGDNTIYIYKTLDSTVFYDGFLTPETDITSNDVDALTDAIGSLVGGLYSGGSISIPYNVAAGAGMLLHTKTDYDSIRFTVGPQWMSYLNNPNVQAWYTVKTGGTLNRVILDAPCVIVDPDAGVITLDLTSTQTNIKDGSYFWQLRLVETISAAPPAVTTYKKRMMMEGSVYIKPAFKEI